jgi:isoquinoline 1-oxidoreductase subunit alpha
MPAYTLMVNGQEHVVDVAADMPLLYVIREILGITGPKYGCGVGICGACTSHVGIDTAARLCVTPVGAVGDAPLTTIEGLAADDGTLHPVQQAWIDNDVAQCGFCQPGQIMAATAKIKQIKAQGRSVTDADLDEIRNVCRCGTYPRIRKAIKAAAAQM